MRLCSYGNRHINGGDDDDDDWGIGDVSAGQDKLQCIGKCRRRRPAWSVDRLSNVIVLAPTHAVELSRVSAVVVR